MSKTRAAREELWNRGVLKWKLFEYQRPVYEDVWGFIHNRKAIKNVLNIARRFGKSFILSLIAIEYAIRYPDSQLRFAAPTAKALRKIIHPAMKFILKDCPDYLRPQWRQQDGYYLFPNGSELHVSGCDNQNYENLRGQAAHLSIVDEAGFVDELDYVVDDVLVPQTLTTGGVVILSSTPPKTPAHSFYAIAQEAEHRGAYIRRTIYDNAAIDEHTRNVYAAEAGGLESSTFRREYLCEFIVDSESQIIPEWKETYVSSPVKDDLYPLWQRYEAMDIGTVDGTAVLFGHYNFRQARLYIETEFVLRGQEVRTDNIANQVLEAEARAFPNQVKTTRIADNNNLILLQDLSTRHNMSFAPTSKDSLHAMVNEVRLWVSAGRLAVDESCTNLIGCLRYGVWREDRKAFSRSSIYGHFDSLAALVYLIRNIDQYSNPIPTLHGHKAFDTYIEPEATEANSFEKWLNPFGRVNEKRIR